jgi:GNAT superfamily N-acetyltransferase
MMPIRTRTYDPLAEYRVNPLAGYSLGRPEAAFPAADDPEYEAVRSGLLDNSLQGLAYVGSVLDKIGGGRAIRGLLGGRPRELLSVIPGSDVLGITDYGQRVSGEDILTGKGLLPQLIAENDPERYQLRDLAGPLFELATDPLSYVSPLPLTDAGLAARRAGTLTRGLGASVGAGERALLGVGLPFRHPSMLLGGADTTFRGIPAADLLGSAEAGIGRVLTSRVPGTQFRPLPALRSLFDYRVAGAMHPDLQRAATEFFTPTREALEVEARRFEAAQREALEPILEAGGTQEQSLHLRGLGEIRPENLAAGGPLAPIGEALHARDVERLRRLREVGIAVPELEGHLPRSLAQVPGRPGSEGVPRPFLPTRSSIQTERRVPAIPGLTPVQEELIADPTVSGTKARLAYNPKGRTAYVLRRILKEQSAGLTQEGVAGAVSTARPSVLKRLAKSLDPNLAPEQLADPEGLRQYLVGAIPETQIGVLTPEYFPASVAALTPRQQLSLFGRTSPLNPLRVQARRFSDYLGTLSPRHALEGQPLFNPDVIADTARHDLKAASQEAAAQTLYRTIGRVARPAHQFEREGIPAVTIDKLLGGGKRRVQSAGLTFNQSEPILDDAGEVIAHYHAGARAQAARALGMSEEEIAALDRVGLRDALRRYAIPTDLANDFARFNQRFFTDPTIGPFRDLIGQANSLFRGLVYPAFLGSHVRNATTAAYNNLRQGGSYAEGGIIERLIGPYRDALRVQRGELPLAGLPEHYRSVARTAEELANPPVRTFGPSTAQVKTDARFAFDIEGEAKRFFGPEATPQDFASAVGAPADATVQVNRHGDQAVVVKFEGPGYSARRTLFIDRKGQLRLKADQFDIDPARQGQGLGTEVVARTVENARRLGITSYELDAAGRGSARHLIPDENPVAGFEVWPKLGFRGPIDELIREDIKLGKVPPLPHGEQTVEALYATPEGREWWQKYGATTELAFDPASGSESSRTLEQYLRRKGLVYPLPPTRPATAAESLRNYVRDAYARGVAFRHQTLQEGLQLGLEPERLFALPPGVRPNTGPLEGTTINPLAVAGVGGQTKTRFLPAALGNILGERVETTARLAQDLALQSRGYAPAAAAERVAQTHFLYDQLAPFEKELRRTLLPFYVFTRKNAERQLRLLAQQPSDITVPIRALTALRGSSYVPGYLGGEAVIPVGGETDEGQQRYIGTLGLPEEEAFGRIKSDPMTGVLGGTALSYAGLLTPYVRSPLEVLANRQFYSGRQLSDLRPYGLSTGFGVLAPNDPRSQLLSQLISTTPLSRVIGTVDKLIDARKGIVPKVLNLGTGLRVTDVDVQAARAVEVRRLLEQALRSSPNVSTLTDFYVPPDLQGQVDPRTAELLRTYARGRLEARRAIEARR